MESKESVPSSESKFARFKDGIWLAKKKVVQQMQQGVTDPRYFGLVELDSNPFFAEFDRLGTRLRNKASPIGSE
jgi:hypothetical protein